ncbi:unnamed protein product [Closterium sp. NIES-53]
MHSRLLVSGLPRSLPPLPPSPAPPCLPCVEGRQRAAPHSSSFPPTSAPLQTLHMDVWGSTRVSGLVREHYFLLVVDDYMHYTTVFPFRSKGEVPAVLIPWIRADHLQLRERFREDLPILRLHCVRGETSPTLCWTGKVGDASVFRVWGSRAFVRDASADKLPSRAIPSIFLGFPPEAPGWQFYHPTSRRVLPSQDVTFDESVPFYHPLPGTVPIKVAVDSGAARGAVSGDAASRGAASGVAEPASAERGGAEPEGAESGCAELGGADPGGTEPEDVEPGGAESEGAEFGGAEPRGTASAGGPAGASPRLSPRREPLSPQQLCEWFALRTRLRSEAAGAGGSAAGGTGAGGAGLGGDGAVSLGGAGVPAGAGGTGGAGAAGPGGVCTRGTRATGAGGVGGARAGDPGVGDPVARGTGAGVGGGGNGDPGVGGAGAGGTDAGGAGAGGTGAGDSGAGDTGAGGAGAGGVGAGDLDAGGAGARGAGARGAGAGGTGAGYPGTGGAGAGGAGAGGTGAGGTVQQRPFFNSPLPAPSPYAEQTDSFRERREPESRPASPVRAVRTGRRIPRPRPPHDPGTYLMALRPSFVPLRVPLPPPPASSLPAVPDLESVLARVASPTVPCLLATVVTDPLFESTSASALVAELVDFAAACRLNYATSLVAESESDCPPSVGSECALGTDVLEDRQEDFECLASAVPHLVAMLLTPEGDSDAPDIPTPRSYAEAITGPYSSQWQTAMDAEIASSKSIGTYGDARDYELHSLDFSTAFLQGSLHEEIWLRRPPGFTGSFPAGTQWSLRRPVYGLRQAPREWHNTVRTMFAALGFSPSIADPSLFLRTETSLPPSYVLVYVDDLVFATTASKAMALVMSELQKRHTYTDLGPSALRLPVLLATVNSSAYRSLALSSTFGHVPRAKWPISRACGLPHEAAKRLLRYLCITSGMGLVLGGRGPVVHIGHADASWRSTHSSSVLSSSCEAEIYAGAMAAQELRWLTYLLTDLGERPHSSPVLYVDKKDMIDLCQEHRTKHIALRYFLARELQQRGQVCLAYVAIRANTTDIFTKALQSGDHQRFCTVLGLVPTLPHLLTA